jgi:TonB family protein
MPRTLTLLLTAVLITGCGAATRAQSGAARARQEVEGKSPAPADDDALKAEQLCEQGRSLAARGDEQRPAARDAFGRALKLYLRVFKKERPGAADAAAQTAFRAMMRGRLKGAPQCVDDYLALGVGTPFEREQLEAFRGQAAMLVEADESRAALLNLEVDERARVTRKPFPGFTEEARRNNVWGTVRLRAVLASDGSVRHVVVLEGLPYGMSEECVAAAKGIRFKPAVKNGRPVSQFVSLEYNFNTH